MIDSFQTVSQSEDVLLMVLRLHSQQTPHIIK